MDQARNPNLDEAGTHVSTSNLKFIDGKLHQLFWPASGASAPEWRMVPAEYIEGVDPAAPVDTWVNP